MINNKKIIIEDFWKTRKRKNTAIIEFLVDVDCLLCCLWSDIFNESALSVHFKWNMFDFRVCLCGKKWNHNIDKKTIDEIGWTPLLSLGQSPVECARYFASGLASIWRDTCVQRLHHSIDEISFTSSYLNRLLFFLIRKLKCLTSFNYHERQREREKRQLRSSTYTGKSDRIVLSK